MSQDHPTDFDRKFRPDNDGFYARRIRSAPKRRGRCTKCGYWGATQFDGTTWTHKTCPKKKS